MTTPSEAGGVVTEGDGLMRGLVVAPQPQAAEIGAEVLEQGGNAFDAAVAAAFAQMVLDPFNCGLGGFGALQYIVGASGEHGVLEFHAKAGAKVRPGMWADAIKGKTAFSGYTLFDDFRSEIGYTSIMTPGAVAGFGALHERFCSWDWADLLKPAMALLENGFPISQKIYEMYTRPEQPGLPTGRQRLTASPEMAKVWLKPDGSFYEPGDLFRNDGMLWTLKRLAEAGPDDFYRGKIAQLIADDLEQNGSYVTADDLAAYRVTWTQPIHSRYRGYDVYGVRPVASGMTFLQILNILEHFDLAALDHNEAAYLHLLASAMAWAHADRRQYMGDPDFVEVPLERLLSKEHAAEQAEQIRRGNLPDRTVRPPVPGTTHLTVWDADENVVTVTHSLGSASGVITPGLGFIYNNSMKLFDVEPDTPNAMAPGKARNTGMCPVIFKRDGKMEIAAGGLGGSVIISSVLQSCLNMIEFGMTPVEAVTAPRIHCEGGAVMAEARILRRAIEGLRAMGHPVEHRPRSYDYLFSCAQVIRRCPDGRILGGSDPRADGGVAAIARG